MNFMTKVFILSLVTFNVSANANVNVKALILNDETIINSRDISVINFDENSGVLNTVELNDQSMIDATDIKSIILKKSHSPSRIHGGVERFSASSGGNGSGG